MKDKANMILLQTPASEQMEIDFKLTVPERHARQCSEMSRAQSIVETAISLKVFTEIKSVALVGRITSADTLKLFFYSGECH